MQAGVLPLVLSFVFLALVTTWPIGVNGADLTWYVSTNAAGGNDGTSPATPFTLEEVFAASQTEASSPGGAGLTWLIMDDFVLFNLTTSYVLLGFNLTDLVIQPAAVNRSVTFNCLNSTANFLWSFSSLKSLILQDIAITNCPGSLLVLDAADVTLTRVRIKGSTAKPTTIQGESTNLVITDSIWEGNKFTIIVTDTESMGGGISVQAKSVTVTGSLFQSNRAYAGTAFYLAPSDTATLAQFIDTKFDGNSGLKPGGGGSLRIEGTSSPGFNLLLESVVFQQNRGYEIAALQFAVGGASNATISRCLFRDHAYAYIIGAIYATAGPASVLSISNTAFLRNGGRDTGALSLSGGILQMSDCLFDENICKYGAAAMYLTGLSKGSYIRNIAIRRNQASQPDVAAVHIEGECDIEGSDFSFNRAAAIEASGANLRISHTTIWSNFQWGITCGYSSINASNAVSLHENNPKGYDFYSSAKHPVEIRCNTCPQFTLSNNPDPCKQCNQTFDVCSVCNGTETKVQNCFAPDPQRKSVFVIPAPEATVAFSRPPLGLTGTTFTPLLSNGTLANQSLILQPIALRAYDSVNGTVSSFALDDGVAGQGVPVIILSKATSPSLDFDYRKLLPNGASVLLRQNLLATPLLQNDPGLPPFVTDGNNLKLSWELLNWPIPAKGPVELEIQLILSDNVTAIQNNITGSPNANNSNIMGFTLFTAKATVTISLATFYSIPVAFSDSGVPIEFQAFPINITTNLTVGSNIQTLIFTIADLANDAITYDPDFGILVTPESGDTGEDSAAGSGDPELLYLLLILVLVPLAGFVIVVAAAGGIAYSVYKKSHRRALLARASGLADAI